MADTAAATPILLKEPVVSSRWEDDEYLVYWEGFVFISGTPSGADSVKAFIDRLRKAGVEEASRSLRGVYFISIERRSDGAIYCFVDNSGLYQAFYTDDTISTSFLSLVRQKGYKTGDLDPRAVVEFLHLGNMFSGRTFFREIRKVPPEVIFHFPRQGRGMKILNKNNGSPGLPGPASFNDEFEGLAESLRNRRVSIDLTGGVDSRLMAVMLDRYGLEFETAISGGTPEYEDVLISRRVAGLIGHPWHGSIHDVSSMEEEIGSVFNATEGLCDVLYYHRLYQFQEARRRRGIDTVISGVGGELFKDYWWLQDFPFYNRRSSNVKRLVDMRIMPFEPAGDILSGAYSERCRGMKDNLVEELSAYIGSTNTRTYDDIYANYMMREQAGMTLTANNRLLCCFAPYLDREIAGIGINLPRSGRFFNAYHRRKITEISPLAAAIPTTENGMSVSSDVAMVLRDLPRFASDRGGRLLIKLGLRKRTAGHRSHPELYTLARKMYVMKEAMDALTGAGIVRNEAKLEDIDDSYLGMYLSVGLLIGFLEGNS